MDVQDFIKPKEKYGAHHYLPLDVVLTHGEGVWVYVTEGRRSLDWPLPRIRSVRMDL
jgi:ornithine--oxo-acid transaminase